MNQIAIRPVSHEMADLERMALAIAASKLFGVQTPDQALALCLVAQAEGRHPATAAGDYSIIQGRPSKKADAMLRDFLSSGGKVEWHKYENEVADATFSHPAGGSVRVDWTMARAKQAGLASAMYSKYPRQMLRARVISEGVRTVFPGATSGMYVPEETVEFEPRGVVTITQVDDLLEGTPQPTKSAFQARKDGDFERLTGAMRECATEAALTAWAKHEADAIGALPHGWKKNLREEYGDILARLRAGAADPTGAALDLPAGETPEEWEEWFSTALQAVMGAQSNDEVNAILATNDVGFGAAEAVIANAGERIAIVAENRLAELAAKESV